MIMYHRKRKTIKVIGWNLAFIFITICGLYFYSFWVENIKGHEQKHILENTVKIKPSNPSIIGKADVELYAIESKAAGKSIQLAKKFGYRLKLEF